MLFKTIVFFLAATAASADRRCHLSAPDTSFPLSVAGAGVAVTPGEQMILTLAGSPKVAVPADASVDVQMYMSGVRIASISENLGARPAATDFTIRLTHFVPNTMPMGSASLVVSVRTSKEVFACLTVPVDVSHPERKLLFMAAGESAFAPSRSHTDVMFLFNSWQDQFSKKFEESDAMLKAMDQFSKNLAKVEAHNAQGKSWQMALNQFAHMGSDEWSAFVKGFSMPERPIAVPRTSADETSLLRGSLKSSAPSSVDWVSEGAVNTPRNQGTCGSCWTFSATGAVEGAYFVKYASLPELSMQQLVECDTTGSGCGGGMMDYAFEWLEGNGGQCAYADYPYTLSASKTAGSCQTTCTPVDGTTPTQYTDVGHTESALKAALAQQPVSVAIEADQDAFQFYDSGVMTGDCGTNLDHGVLAVGYGTDSDDGAYWTIKNSWGTTWGEDGYIRIERGKDQTYGQCGVLKMASFPTL